MFILNAYFYINLCNLLCNYGFNIQCAFNRSVQANSLEGSCIVARVSERFFKGTATMEFLPDHDSRTCAENNTQWNRRDATRRYATHVGVDGSWRARVWPDVGKLGQHAHDANEHCSFDTFRSLRSDGSSPLSLYLGTI